MQCSLNAVQTDMQILKNASVPIIIFGSSIVAQAIYYECIENNINIECFCDNSTHKIGKDLFGLHVIHPNKLRDSYPDAVVIISVSDIQDIVLQLKQLKYLNYIAGALLLKEFDINKHSFNASYEYIDYAISTAVLCHEGYINKDKLYLRSIDIIITEKCSLKCEGCSNLSQYYENPKNDDINDSLLEIDKICHYIDEINEFRVIGGEPFMNRNIHLIVEKLISKENVRKVVIFTNATIIPTQKQIEIFKNKKVLFVITDYKELSKNTKTVVSLCETNGIGYYCEEVSGWTECSSIKKHHRSIDEQKDVFKRCCAKNLITLSKGKLYRCPFIANAYRLNALTKSEQDFVDVLDDRENIKDELYDFLLNRQYLDGCDFCAGRFLDDELIKPAIQIEKPLKYIKYEK